MVHEFTRPLKADVRRQLEQTIALPSRVSVGRTLKRLGVWFLVLVGCLALIAISMQLPEPMGTILAIVPNIVIVVSLGVMVLLIVDHRRDERIERLWRNNELPKLERAVADDTVAVRKVQPTGVVEIWPFEDEGGGYIFDVGGGRILHMSGQWTEIRDDVAPWPNTDFEIVRTTHDRLFINLVCHGVKLEPVRTIDSSELIEHDWEEHDDLFDGELHAFADSLIDPYRGKHPLE